MNRRNAIKTLAIASVAVTVAPTLGMQKEDLNDLRTFLSDQKKSLKVLVYGSEDDKPLYKQLAKDIQASLPKDSKIEFAIAVPSVALTPTNPTPWLRSYDVVLYVRSVEGQTHVKMMNLGIATSSRVWVV